MSVLRDLYGGRTAVATCLAVVAVAAPLAAAAEAQDALSACPTAAPTASADASVDVAELRELQRTQAASCAAVADRLDRARAADADHAARAHDDAQAQPTPPAVQQVQLTGEVDGTSAKPVHVDDGRPATASQTVALGDDDARQLFSIRWGVMALIALGIVGTLLAPVLRRVWLP